VIFRPFFVLFLGLGVSIGGWAQTTSQPTTTPVTPTTPQTATVPAEVPVPAVIPVAAPYKDDEFPLWLRKIRRAEIIAVGAFPIAYMFSGIGYDYYYYLSNDYPSGNIPWPVGSGTSLWTPSSNGADLQRKNLTILATAAAIGVVIAAIDWFLSP